MKTDRATTLNSSKPMTPKTLIMLSSEKLKNSFLNISREHPKKFHRKNSSMPDKLEQFQAKSVKNCKKSDADFFYFSRIVEPTSRLKSANLGTRRKIINNAYTRVIKGHKKKIDDGLFHNERIRNSSNWDSFFAARHKVTEKQMGIMLNYVLGKPATANFLEEGKRFDLGDGVKSLRSDRKVM